MRSIDVIIISLPERKDRLNPLCDFLDRNKINYVVFDAIKNEDGQQGIIESIYKLFSEIKDKDFSEVIILEDDAFFIVDNPFDLIEKCMMQIPFNYDLCYLGCNLFQSNVEAYTPNLIQVFGAWALHSVVYSKKAVLKVLKAIEERKDNSPLDTLIVEKIQVDGNSFCTIPMIVTQSKGYSDILNKNVDYTNILENRFKEKTKNIV